VWHDLQKASAPAAGFQGSPPLLPGASYLNLF
jgi:hypothetical protein